MKKCNDNTTTTDRLTPSNANSLNTDTKHVSVNRTDDNKINPDTTDDILKDLCVTVQTMSTEVNYCNKTIYCM